MPKTTIDGSACSRCFKKLTNDDPQLLVSIMDLVDMFAAEHYAVCVECCDGIKLILAGVH